MSVSVKTMSFGSDIVFLGELLFVVHIVVQDRAFASRAYLSRCTSTTPNLARTSKYGVDLPLIGKIFGVSSFLKRTPPTWVSIFCYRAFDCLWPSNNPQPYHLL